MKRMTMRCVVRAVTVKVKLSQARPMLSGLQRSGTRSLSVRHDTGKREYRPMQEHNLELSRHFTATCRQLSHQYAATDDTHQPEPSWRPKVVVFDKNGTLINFHVIWVPWVKALTERLERETGLILDGKVNETLNICVFTNRVRQGVLAEGTSAQIKRHLNQLLVEEGLEANHAKTVVNKCWKDCDTSNPETLKQFADLKLIFERLKCEGIKIAICTSDIRRVTEKTLGKLGILALVDILLCGDDPPQPNEQALSSGGKINHICKELGVSTSQAVVVGDTEGDVAMGKQAGVGAIIGVLSGIGNRLELAPYSNFITENVKEAVDIILEGIDRKEGDLGYVNFSGHTKASLVIFDKDGTLLCFHSMWTPWAKALVKRLEAETGLSLYHKLMEELGYDHSREQWTPGMLAEGTTGQNKELITNILQEEGLAASEARQALDKSWIESDHTEENSNLKPVDNPTALFKTLKELGIKVAVCTADSRVATEEFLLSQGATPYVDMLVCGDDPGTHPKPAAHNALYICRALGVHPAAAVMVGDTSADLGMGRRAKLGATVGVLTGVGRPSDLDNQADHVVPSIKHVLPLVLKDYGRAGTGKSEASS